MKILIQNLRRKPSSKVGHGSGFFGLSFERNFHPSSILSPPSRVYTSLKVRGTSNNQSLGKVYITDLKLNNLIKKSIEAFNRGDLKKAVELFGEKATFLNSSAPPEPSGMPQQFQEQNKEERLCVEGC